MKGSILGEMANAVENSAVIMIAMTESYKNSNSCRTGSQLIYLFVSWILEQTSHNGIWWVDTVG